MTGASGAGRTGLSNLLELHRSGGIGDAFVAVALAGTLFFSTSVDQARGRAAFALIVTIAPYAILAPLIGPMLDRVRQGNKYILMGTLLARGLLCWGMAGAVQHNDAVTLLPAALGVLVLQKAYAVTKAAVTPRLLPSEITLVSANARFNLASLLATSAGAAVALGVDKISAATAAARPGCCGSAPSSTWPRRCSACGCRTGSTSAREYDRDGQPSAARAARWNGRSGTGRQRIAGRDATTRTHGRAGQAAGTPRVRRRRSSRCRRSARSSARRCGRTPPSGSSTAS